jgi:hypothetical protein
MARWLELGAGPDAERRDLAVGGVGNLQVAAVISWFSAVSSTVFVSCFNSPSGPVSDRPCSRARRTSSSAARSSAVGSALIFFFVTSSSVAVITAPLPPSRKAQRDWAGNTVTGALSHFRW